MTALLGAEYVPTHLLALLIRETMGPMFLFSVVFTPSSPSNHGSVWVLLVVSLLFTYTHKVRTYKEYHSVCPSSELGLPPTPHPQASVPPPPCFWGEGNTRRLVCPLPPVSGGRGTLAGEKGVGRVPIPTRGIHCGTLYMYVLCAYTVSSVRF